VRAHDGIAGITLANISNIIPTMMAPIDPKDTMTIILYVAIATNKTYNDYF